MLGHGSVSFHCTSSARGSFVTKAFPLGDRPSHLIWAGSRPRTGNDPNLLGEFHFVPLPVQARLIDEHEDRRILRTRMISRVFVRARATTPRKRGDERSSVFAGLLLSLSRLFRFSLERSISRSDVAHPGRSQPWGGIAFRCI
jgi:hypothetical protein